MFPCNVGELHPKRGNKAGSLWPSVTCNSLRQKDWHTMSGFRRIFFSSFFLITYSVCLIQCQTPCKYTVTWKWRTAVLKNNITVSVTNVFILQTSKYFVYNQMYIGLPYPHKIFAVIIGDFRPTKKCAKRKQNMLMEVNFTFLLSVFRISSTCPVLPFWSTQDLHALQETSIFRRQPYTRQ